MSTFLEEKRAAALQPENNTAQADMLDLLETLHPAITDLVFPGPLTGDIDFIILKECNFTNITAIRIPPGNITSVRNLPDFISEFACPSNLLIELEDLPPNLVILDIKDNGFKRMSFKDLRTLKTLDIRRNLFVDIRGLPESLEKLYCSNNRIKILDLDGIDNLTTLYCENNAMISIEHFPDTIIDLRMENNPNIETYTDETYNEKDKDKEKIADIQDALQKYFKMKAKYETDRINKKRDIYKVAKQNGLGKKAIDNRLRTLRIKCIKCGNPGSPEGTIFKVENRNYTAVCGSSNPCDLNIKIFAGLFSDLYYYLTVFKESVEYSKSDIIQNKLDSLFNYMDEVNAKNIFKKTMDDYSDDNGILKNLLDNYNDIYENKERSEKIKEKQFIIDQKKSIVNDLINQYAGNGIQSVLNQAMESYATELLPEVRNIRFLLNEINEVILRGEKRILFQKIVQLQKLDYTMNDPAKIERFIT